MILVKALWLALVDVFGMFKLSPKLIIELVVSLLHVLMALIGVVSLVLSLVLFPLIVWRKYQELKQKKSKKVIRKFGVVRA